MGDDKGHRRRLRLDPSPGSVSAARRLASDAAAGWGFSQLCDDAVLVVSELVTNAVLHARTPVEVTLERLSDGIRVQVGDGSTAPPRPHALTVPDSPSSLLSGEEDIDVLEGLLSIGATTGRGLGLVERLAASWGSAPVPAGDGKVVWADLRTGGGATGEITGVAGAPAGPVPADPSPRPERLERPAVADRFAGAVDRSHPVRLVAVPVRLALESAMNLESVLREFQVLDLNGAASGPAGALLAAAAEILDRHPSVKGSIDDALALALDRGDRLFDVDLLVPPGAVAAMHRLGRLLDDVSRYSDRGDLLVLAPSAELRSFRSWCVEELDRQSGGHPPRPCPFSTIPADPDGALVASEPSPYARQELARIADALGEAPDATAVVELLLSEAVRSLGATSASLCMQVADSDTLEVIDSIGMDPSVVEHWRYFGLGDDLPSSEAIRTGRPIVVRTPLELDVRYPAFRGTPVQGELSVVSVPLCRTEPTAAGALSASFAQSRDFTAGDLQLLSELCGLAADALDRVGAAGRDGRNRDQERLILTVTSAVAGLPDGELASRLQAVVAVVAHWFGAWCDAFVRPSGVADGSSLRHVAGSHPDPGRARQMADMHRRWPPRPDVGAIARCMTTRETVVFQVVPDQLLARTSRSPEHLDTMRRLGFSSLVAAPVCDADEVVAVLGVACPGGRYFTDEEVRLVEEVARRVSR